MTRPLLRGHLEQMSHLSHWIPPQLLSVCCSSPPLPLVAGQVPEKHKYYQFVVRFHLYLLLQGRFLRNTNIISLLFVSTSTSYCRAGSWETQILSVCSSPPLPLVAGQVLRNTNIISLFVSTSTSCCRADS